MKTKPFPKGQKLPDIKPPTAKEQVETIPAPIPQPELPRKHRSQAETLKAAEEDTQLVQEKAKQNGKLMGLENLSLAQAILSAEILGQPRCRQRRIR